MEKILIVIMVACMLSGCEIFDMSNIYSDEDRIASQSNSFSMNTKKQDIKNDTYTGNMKFEGMDTIWEIDTYRKEKVKIDYEFEVKSGSAKLVLINPDDEIEIIAEVSNGKVVKDEITLSLDKGKNRIKLVGKDNANIKLELSVSDGKLHELGLE